MDQDRQNYSEEADFLRHGNVVRISEAEENVPEKDVYGLGGLNDDPTSKEVGPEEVFEHQDDARYLTATELGNKYKAEYTSWRLAKSRAKDKGMEFAEEFEDFRSFLFIMGPKGDPTYTLDRIDNEVGYSPNNCRWADKTEQAKNRRNVKFITANGETKTMTDWARETGQSPATLSKRLSRGLKDAEVIFGAGGARFTRKDFYAPWPEEKADGWNRAYLECRRRDEHPCEFYYRFSREQETLAARPILDYGYRIEDVPEPERSKIEPDLKKWRGYVKDATPKYWAWIEFKRAVASKRAMKKVEDEVRRDIHEMRGQLGLD